MKSLSLSRPLVIMVIGLPGSGKSFFARQFADMFGAPLVSSDFLRHAIYNPRFSPEEDAVIHALMHNAISELVKTGKTFIVDGGVNNRTVRHGIERLASARNYGKLTIWVQTDEPTSLARSTKRSPKKATDALNAPMDVTAFERYRKQFSIPLGTENAVVISGKHTYATQARVVLKKLVAPRDNAPIVRPITVSATETETETKTEPQHDTKPRRRNLTIN